jgi:hypothetical protein
MNLNVGDLIRYNAHGLTGDSRYRELGRVLLLPGMVEYDTRGYTAAASGCVYITERGTEWWAHQKNLELVKRPIIWEV